MGKFIAVVCSQVATSCESSGCLNAIVATKLIMGHIVQQVKIPRNKVMSSAGGQFACPEELERAVVCNLAANERFEDDDRRHERHHVSKGHEEQLGSQDHPP